MLRKHYVIRTRSDRFLRMCLQLHSGIILHKSKSSGGLVTRATKFCKVTANSLSVIISVFSLYRELYVSSLALSRKCQITVRFTGRYRFLELDHITLLTPNLEI
jgi:hypothetical protein